MAARVTSARALPDGAWQGTGVAVADVLERLAELRRPPDAAPLTLAGVLTLAVYAPAVHDVPEIRATIARLADHGPSRVVIVVETEEGTGIDASVRTGCRATDDHVSVALEEVVLTLHGEGRAGDASAVVPLLRPDLPTVLWWPGALDQAGPLGRLLPLADRLVSEVARHDGDLAPLARLVPGTDAAVTDLAWAAVTPWRQLVLQILDGAPLAEARVEHPAPDPGPEARLLAAWLSELGPAPRVALHGAAGRPGALRALALRGEGWRDAVEVEHVPERCVATVRGRARDGAERERVLPLPVADRAHLLAGELEVLRRDAPFERALARAAA